MAVTQEERLERLQEKVKGSIAGVFADKTELSEVTLSETDQVVV